MSFIHPLADVSSISIGRGTRVWQYSVILKGARIGENCNICAHTFIEDDVTVGDRVTIKCGVFLWNGCTIENDVFLGPNATFTNDRYPRSRDQSKALTGVRVGRHASVGANATILPGITIGEYAMIGAGAVVTTDVPPRALVAGNPARILRFVS